MATNSTGEHAFETSDSGSEMSDGPVSPAKPVVIHRSITIGDSDSDDQRKDFRANILNEKIIQRLFFFSWRSRNKHATEFQSYTVDAI